MTRTLARLRKEHRALRHGDWRLLWQGKNAFAYERATEDERVVVVVNRGAKLEALRLPVTCAEVEVLWGDATAAAVDEGLLLSGLGAQTGVVLRPL